MSDASSASATRRPDMISPGRSYDLCRETRPNTPRHLACRLLVGSREPHGSLVGVELRVGQFSELEQL
jgi:hypothetical protein